MRTVKSVNVSVEHDESIYYKEIFGTSSDSKPTDVAMGSSFTEVDTGDVYLYNEDASEWVKQYSLQQAEATVEETEPVEEET